MSKISSEQQRAHFEAVTLAEPFCMDGRPLLFHVQGGFEQSEPVITASTAEKPLIGPRLPGGGLGFLAVLEEQGLSRVHAFELVEQALLSLGYQPAFHVDTHGGHTAHEEQDLEAVYAELFAAQNIVEFLNVVLKHLIGCGLVAIHWMEYAAAVAQEAVRRGWSIQILAGDHQEENVYKNTQDGTALNPHNQQAFAIDLPFTAKVCQRIEELMLLNSPAAAGMGEVLYNAILGKFEHLTVEHFKTVPTVADIVIVK